MIGFLSTIAFQINILAGVQTLVWTSKINLADEGQLKTLIIQFLFLECYTYSNPLLNEVQNPLCVRDY